MPRVEDGAMVVAGLKAGERVRVGLEVIDDPGAGGEQDDDQQTRSEVLLHAPAIVERIELLLAC